MFDEDQNKEHNFHFESDREWTAESMHPRSVHERYFCGRCVIPSYSHYFSSVDCSPQISVK